MSATEILVLAAFRAALGGAGDYGPDDHFFDAGADSLSAEAAMAQISEALGVELPLYLLLDHPSARALAAAIDRGETG